MCTVSTVSSETGWDDARDSGGQGLGCRAEVFFVPHVAHLGLRPTAPVAQCDAKSQKPCQKSCQKSKAMSKAMSKAIRPTSVAPPHPFTGSRKPLGTAKTRHLKGILSAAARQSHTTTHVTTVTGHEHHRAGIGRRQAHVAYGAWRMAHGAWRTTGRASETELEVGQVDRHVGWACTCGSTNKWQQTAVSILQQRWEIAVACSPELATPF